LALAEAMVVRGASSLEGYLERFAWTLALLQDRASLRRVAYELAEDHAAENVRYVEVRFCPALCTAGGLTAAEVLDATLEGLALARREHGIEARIIVCGLRSLRGSTSHEMAELAVAYRDRGVCAFDLAGAESGHPVHDHLEALRAAERAGLPVTIHAGEAYGPESIREAVELGQAKRIGHGTRLFEDPLLLREVRDAGIALEVCLTSNVQTGVVGAYAAHPLRQYLDEGLRVCLCTDNRLISGVTLAGEYEHARDDLGCTWSELVRIARAGFECAFTDEGQKAAMLTDFDASVSTTA
jgi:adenosine deaminase